MFYRQVCLFQNDYLNHAIVHGFLNLYFNKSFFFWIGEGNRLFFIQRLLKVRDTFIITNSYIS